MARRMVTRLSTGVWVFVTAVLVAAGCQSGSGAGGTGGSGATGIGGSSSTGGVTGSGGSSSTGGSPGSGGSVGTGGRAGSGGANSGGTTGSGGTGSGGTTGTGGATGGTGGSTGSGGAGMAGKGGTAGAGGQVGTGGSGGSGGLTCGAPPTGTAYAVDSTGVTFTLNPGRMRVQVCKEDVMRVEYTSASAIPAKTSLSVSATWGTPSFCVTESAGVLTIATSRMKAKVTESSGLVTYTDLADNLLVSENSKSLKATTVEGVSTNTVKAAFNSPASEALFGLGQHQDGVMNRKGSTLHMLNANTQIQIPVLVSNKGYGLFWDNYSTTDFAGNVSSNTQYSFSSETGDLVDYYFFYGPTIDQVIAGYRVTTGAAPLFPKWAYGLFQSKDHYQSSNELLSVEKGYRDNNIPVDVIVQDWQYWSPYVWGSQLMDPSRYPDPAGLVNQLHAANVHTMISIWPLYQTRNPATAMVTGELDPYNSLNAINALYPDTTSGGLYHFYDTFNSMARTLSYQYDHDRLLGKYGWDAIWADNTEPQSYPEGVNVHAATTALGKGAFYINAYPLEHNRGIYEGWRSIGPNNKRVYILTRSAFAGQQRYAAGAWSGDINATASVYAAQIPGGLGYAISGLPYWTTDIGGYFGTPTEELFTRWFQFGAFCPTFRIHGQAPKELYGSQWSATGKANMLAVDNLRYRLMPYIYSLAWMVTNQGYTIMRPLVFDFQNDTKVYGIGDQYMFGPALLVNPVTATGATSRSVYLPAGTWYDFWTGMTAAGGATSTVTAPLSQIPLFVRAGSILPMGPMIQYATQSADPLEIRVYKGQNGTFTLYEDAGDTYDYETGQHAQIQFSWDDTAQQLTIGARTGSYTGMLSSRTFNVVWVGASHGAGLAVSSTPDQVVKYTGAQVAVSAK
jgi:alpha-D-xyloside xylohydrolase